MRNRSRLQNSGLAIVLIVTIAMVSTPCHAQQQNSESAGEPDAAQTEIPPTRSEAADTDAETREAEPATRFTPTEKIRAADTLSLPVDI